MNRWLVLSGVGFVALVLALLIGEAALRLLGFEHSSPFIAYDKNCYWRMAPNQTFTMTGEDGSPVSVTINSLGARGPEIDVEKPAGVRRILCLGDSYTYGFSVDDSQTFPAYLQKKLDDASIPTQVMNFGCNGHTILQEVGLLKAYGLRLKPDIVLVAFCFNDFRDIDEIDIHLGHMPKPGYNAVKYLLRKTAVGNLVLNIKTKKKAKDIFKRRQAFSFVSTAHAAEKSLDAFGRYIEKMDELMALSETHDFQVVFVMVPWGRAPLDEIVIEKKYREEGEMNLKQFKLFLEARYKKNFRVIELLSHIKSKDHFLPDSHLNSKGNEKAAAIIFENL